MKVLVLTIVFPNEKQPTLGVFVRERVCALAKFCDVKVLTPTSWFPLAERLKKNYHPLVPRKEAHRGVEVFHPKFFSIPGLFKMLDGFFLFLSCVRAAFKIKRRFDFDVIDAHFAYPDGFAAVLLAKLLRKPVAITTRGTEIKHARYSWRGRAVKYALRRATKIISVSNSLEKSRKEIEQILTPSSASVQKFWKRFRGGS